MLIRSLPLLTWWRRPHSPNSHILFRGPSSLITAQEASNVSISERVIPTTQSTLSKPLIIRIVNPRRRIQDPVDALSTQHNPAILPVFRIYHPSAQSSTVIIGVFLLENHSPVSHWSSGTCSWSQQYS